MGLPQAGRRDLHELGVLLQLLNGAAAGVAHTGPQAAHELIDGVAGGSLVGDTALHALGDQLLVVLLEIAVLGAVVHGGQGAHAPVGLELTALIDLGVAGGLLTAGQQRADHDHAAAGGDGFHDVAGELHAAVGDDGHAVLGGHPGGVIDGGDLGYADAGHHAGGADGAGADAHLHAVGARLDEGAGALGGGHVAGDQLHVGVEGLDALDGLQHVLGVAVGGVQAQHVHAGLHQGGHPVQHVGGGADGGAHQQAALLVTGGVGVHLGLLDVLDGDEALQTEVLVHDGQLLDLVLAEDLLGLGQGGALGRGDQVLLGHHVVDELVHVGLELHVPVGDDADELTVVADGHAGDAELGHQLVRLGQGVAGSQPEGVGDDPVLGALHHVHLLGLLADGHIFMDDADAALPGDGDGHAVLGDGIHGGAD